MNPPSATPADELTVTVVSSGDSVRVIAVGAIDHSSVPRLAAALTSAGHGRAVEVILDLDAVPFIDSDGLQLLNDTHRTATEAGGRLHIVAKSRAVVRPLEAIGLWQVSRAPQQTARGDLDM